MTGEGLLRAALAACLLAAGIACAGDDDPVRAGPPSVLLVVLDTVRADAVSPTGETETTPTLDRLAREGAVYTRAYAQAPWTLPSHATLFSGLPPDRHGVDARRPRAPDELVMLAERFRAAGYQTAGVSENPWIHSSTNLVQGFEWFRNAPFEADASGEAAVRLDQSLDRLEDWLAESDPARPFFLFLNFIDAHAPYLVRETNPFLPATAGRDEAQRVLEEQDPGACTSWPRDSRAMRVLHGLYLGGVAAADAKLARALGMVEQRLGDVPRITVVTSDHGEHFGEGGMRDHFFSLHDALLHVPLVVHGGPAEPGARIAEPVALMDLAPSLLAWAGLEAPDELPGRPLPTTSGDRGPARTLTARFRDPLRAPSPAGTLGRLVVESATALREGCSSERAGGDLRAAIRHPFKLVRRDGGGDDPGETALYDLASDPGETRDLSQREPQRAARLAEALATPTADADEPGTWDAADDPPEEVIESLRALGYLPRDD